MQDRAGTALRTRPRAILPHRNILWWWIDIQSRAPQSTLSPTPLQGVVLIISLLRPGRGECVLCSLRGRFLLCYVRQTECAPLADGYRTGAQSVQTIVSSLAIELTQGEGPRLSGIRAARERCVCNVALFRLQCRSCCQQTAYPCNRSRRSGVWQVGFGGFRCCS